MFERNDDQRQLVDGNVNHSDKVLPAAPGFYDQKVADDQKAIQKKKRCLIGGAIVGVLLLILIIILIVTSKGGDDPSPEPGPPGPTPPKGSNPYNVLTETVDMQVQYVTATLEASDESIAAIKANRPVSEGPNGVDIVYPFDIPTGNNNQMMKKVKFEAGQSDYKVSYVSLTDAENDRFSPPEDLVSRPRHTNQMRLDMCGFQMTNSPFGFSYTDTRDSSNVLVSTEDSAFFMSDKYMQLDLQLPTQRVYGLGERSREFGLSEGTWTMWANGQESPYDEGQGSKQTYGVHPFALVQTKTPGEYFGIFFRNANAQSPVLKFKEDGGSTLSYVTTGGMLDIYFFFKGSAKEVIALYQSTIGKPRLPPFWSLGWNAASKGYLQIQDVADNVANYASAGIPLEGVWLDIPYMDNFADFSVDGVKFAGLSEYQKILNTNGQKLMVTINAGISADQLDDPIYVQAQADNALIKSSVHVGGDFKGALTTEVWSKHNVFLDLFGSVGTELWEKGLKDLYDIVAYDGILLSVNEAYSKCDGECPAGKQENEETFLKVEDEPTDHKWYHSYPQDYMSTYELPFIVGQYNLDNLTLSLNATHPSTGYRQYDTHSLNGHLEAKKTWEFMTSANSPNSNNRQLLLSRSTFAGSGQYAQHWLGDNHRTWEDMKYSVAGVMNFNMFGIPMVGPDTCGYMGLDGQDELCARWVQLATFFPFARQNQDDSAKGGQPNEVWRLAEPFKTMAKNAIIDRFQYMRLMYTCLFEASQDGGSCFDPLFFHFPNDEGAYDNTEHTFIVANALKVSPVLESNTTKAETNSVYFPAGTWVSMANYADIIVQEQGGMVDLEIPGQNDLISTHLMEGKLIPFQDKESNSWNGATRTKDVASASVSLVANRDKDGHAEGKLFLDDGLTRTDIPNVNAKYDYHEFQLSANSLKVWINSESREDAESRIDSLVITNAEDLKDTNFACATAASDLTITTLNYIYDADKKTLTIDTPEQSPALLLHDLRDIHFGDDSKDINLCDISKAYYKVKGDEPDLTKPQASCTLESGLPDVHPDLTLTLSRLATDVINVHWTFADDKRKQPFEVPVDIIQPNKDQLSDQPLSDFVVVDTSQGPISIKILNQDQVVFSLNGMVLSDYLNIIDGTAFTDVTTNGIMGLAERTVSDLFLQDGVYSLWSRDIPNPEETGKAPGNNLYGTHPFYMGKAKGATEWFGVYTNLAAAQDWWIKNGIDAQSQKNGEISVKSYATGGLGDMYFMVGADPETVTKKYHTIVGKPVLTPQWALGWNQCKWGYLNTQELEWVVGNYSHYGIPLDTQWSDIDWLSDYRDFTYDEQNFAGLPAFVESLHDKNMHYIPIIDAGVAIRDSGYEAYTDGKDKDVFIKNQAGEILAGQVWPDDAAFPDFFGENTESWWQEWLGKVHDMVPFDGLWLDMNEASNFCNGVCYDNQKSDSPVKYKLPYVPTGRDLETKSLSLDAVHANGVTQLDAHSLFGTQEVKASHGYFESQNMRTMIIERSSFAGIGKYGSRWLGDNFARVEYMGYSVTGIMAHNIIGIPLAGSDICGFLEETTPELCTRWHVLGSFYPFSRNHNDIASPAQEPYVEKFQQPIQEGATTTYMDIMKKAIQRKYHMIRYYNTQITKLHLEGGTFFKPLFFAFPDDPGAYVNQENNIMLGDALKLSMLTNALNQETTEFYFPAGTWCNVLNMKLGTDSCKTYATGTTETLSSFISDYYLHLRSGYIFPTQDATSLGAMNTYDLQQHPVEFHINAECSVESCAANGEYINDDGLTNTLEGNQNVYGIEFQRQMAQDFFKIEITQTTNAENLDNMRVNANDKLGSIQVLQATAQGYSTEAYKVEATMIKDAQVVDLGTAQYDSASDRLVWQAGDNELWLPEVDFIQFTKQQ